MNNNTTIHSEDILPEPSELIFLGAIFVVTFISTILPLQLVSNLRNVIDPEKRSLYKRIVSILNCFAGGVFLGTALLDLFPHVMSNIKEALPNSTFPFPEFIIGFGFLIILTTEQIIIDCKERTSDCRNPIERLQTRNIQLERETLTVNTQDEAIQKTSPDLLPKEENRSLQLKFHSILLLAALSLHSLFEGLTLGLIQSPAFVLQLFLAILIHKIPVAFSLGLHLVQSELKISAVIHFDLWFSLMTPIGTGIGILLKIMTPNVQTNLINGIAIGLATGTFIFVVFVEILPKELKLGRSRLPNLLFFILGFSFICATILFKRKY